MSSAHKHLLPPKMAALPAKLPPPLAEPHWHSRGYLPHLDQLGLIQTITFRLHDALPQSQLKEWQRELELSQPLPEERERLLYRRIEKHLDAGYGACWLRSLQVGKIVEDAMLFFDDVRYHLLSWCVMPNHVHVLLEAKPGWEIGQLVHSWKSFSAQRCNKLLGRKGHFWQREYHDRYIRDAAHLQNAIRYITENPVKACLVSNALEWPLGSARFTGSAAIFGGRRELADEVRGKGL